VVSISLLGGFTARDDRTRLPVPCSAHLVDCADSQLGECLEGTVLGAVPQ
jgi:hypothetical protein